ncbi:MAG: ABC transporter substrate-binding protein [Thermoproteota archaeon]
MIENKRSAFFRQAIIKMWVIVIAIIIAVAAIASIVIYYVTRPPAVEPIKIGVLTPLSAPADFVSGSLIKRTAEIFVEYQNNKGGVLGRPLELVVADQTLDTGTAISNLIRMVTSDRIVGLIGPWESSVALPIAEATKDQPVIMFVTFSWADNITANKYKYVFRLGVANLLVSKGTIEFVKYAGYKRAAVICEESAYGIGMWQGLVKWRDELYPELELIPIFTKPGKTDYTPELTSIATMNPPPDVIIMNNNLPHVNIMTKQLHEMGLTPAIPMVSSYAYNLVDPKSFWETVGEAGIGLIFQDYSSPFMEYTATGKEFLKIWGEKVGGVPPVWICWYWDALRILVKAIEDTKSTNPDVLKDYSENISIEGTTGWIKFENDPTPGSVLWHQWTNFTYYFFKLEKVGDTTEHQIYPPH